MTTIKIQYEEAKDYRSIPVTGIWGGVAPNGEIFADFFIERQKSPSSTHIEIDESGKLVKETPSGQKYIREKQIGIILRPDIALSIGNWLVDKAKEAMKSSSGAK